jgi:hypothetical protein
MGRGELARALRAMATELERDPTLARRISEAMRDLTGVQAPAHAAGEQGAASATHSAEPGPQEKKSKRASRAFRPRVVEGMSPALGTGIPDPFALRARLGEAGLRAALRELRLGSLRAIVREHHLDPAGAVVRGNDAEKLRALILARTARS